MSKMKNIFPDNPSVAFSFASSCLRGEKPKARKQHVGLAALFILLIPVLTSAQTLLTADEALKIGLKNNFEILIAKNEAQADSILNSWGEAGALPSVFLNAGVSKNSNNIHQQYSNGNEIRSNNAGGQNLTAGIALSWTLFDGTKMFVTKNKLEQIEQLGYYDFRSTVLDATGNILLSYYDIVRQQQQINATDEIIKYNEERVKITEARFNAGLSPKTDMLQAKIDLNVQKENKINLVVVLTQAKKNLNTLLARDVKTEFTVEDSITLSPLTDRAELEQKMYAGNPSLLAFKSQLEISKLAYRETRTQYFPKLALNAGYNFARAESSAGFSLYNQSYGWSTGLVFTMPIYQGGNVNRDVKIAKLDIQSAEFRMYEANLSASLALQNALAIYDAREQALALENENEKMSRENMNLALERLRLGQGNALEVAQAQATLASSLFRVSAFNYDMKSAEINVRKQAATL
jgi:outer membrane protein TolC